VFCAKTASADKNIKTADITANITFTIRSFLVGISVKRLARYRNQAWAGAERKYVFLSQNLKKSRANLIFSFLPCSHSFDLSLFSFISHGLSGRNLGFQKKYWLVFSSHSFRAKPLIFTSSDILI
jgi:hypothetical protein